MEGERVGVGGAINRTTCMVNDFGAGATFEKLIKINFFSVLLLLLLLQLLGSH
jgi:hypothetical protein